MPRHMLVADDKASMRDMLEAAFVERDFKVAQASNGLDAINLIKEQVFDVVITDLNMPGADGLGVLRAARDISPDTQVILITAYGTIETAVEAMRLGARDFIRKPFKLSEIELKVDKILRDSEVQAAPPLEKTWMHPKVQRMVGTSAHTKNLLRTIEKIAPGRGSVLITGPTGVGKELVAHAIHDASPRRDMPFVALNCAALAPGVLESELFGHEKGSFTGASDRKIGRFEKADTGTLFLDEVGEIDAGIQVKLLRVLQEGEFERVGGTKSIKVDVRVLAATNRDLSEAIKQGRFREDFYYRLNVFSVHVEPLKNRKDDIPALIDHLLRKFSMESGHETRGIDDEVMEFFLRYPWPGNVRELENVLERAVVLAEEPIITRKELPQDLLFTQEEPEPEAVAAAAEGAEQASLLERTDKLESELIRGALERFRWNKTKAAEHLGIKRTTLQYKIKKYGLE